MDRAMVLGHERVFCWGGQEQRAVHKGCGVGRQRRLDGSTKETSRIEKPPIQSLCLTNKRGSLLQRSK